MTKLNDRQWQTQPARSSASRQLFSLAAALLMLAATMSAQGSQNRNDDGKADEGRNPYAIGLWGDLPYSDVQALTGYIRGGVTVLAAKKDYPVYLDESALDHETISISAGVRGTQILLSPTEYVRITGAVTGIIARPKSLT